MPTPTRTRDDLLKLTAREYLKNGFTDRAGRPAPELTGLWATAAATQFEAAQAAAQEVAGTCECLRQVLPWHQRTENPALRAAEAAEEALETAARLYQKENHPAIIRWLDACVAAVKTDGDLELLQKHFEAVAFQYSLIAGIKAP